MAVNESLNELYGESGGSAAVPAGALGAVASTNQDTDEEYGTIEVLKLRKVKLGRQGENGTQDVVIDCSAWMPELSGCQLMIAAMRPGERKIYVPTVSVSGNVITWPIAAQDVAYAGWGRAEVRGMLNGQIRKSRLFVTYVEPSLEGDGSAEPPTPPDWAQEIIDAVDEAAALVEAATMCAVNAVRFDENQGLKDAQKATARGNIDAASTGTVDELKSAIIKKTDNLLVDNWLLKNCTVSRELNKIKVSATNANNGQYAYQIIDVQSVDAVSIAIGEITGNGEPMVRLGTASSKESTTWSWTTEKTNASIFAVDTSSINFLVVAIYAIRYGGTVGQTGDYSIYSDLMVYTGREKKPYAPPVSCVDFIAQGQTGSNKEVIELLTNTENSNLLSLDKWRELSANVKHEITEEKKIKVSIINEASDYRYAFQVIDVRNLSAVTISGYFEGTGQGQVRVGSANSLDAISCSWIGNYSSLPQTIDVSTVDYLFVAIYASYNTSQAVGNYILYSNMTINAGSNKKTYILNPSSIDHEERIRAEKAKPKYHSVDVEKGSINTYGDDIAYDSSDPRMRTGYIYLYEGDTFFPLLPNMEFAWRFYNDNKAFISYSGWLTKPFIVENEGFYRFVARRTVNPKDIGFTNLEANYKPFMLVWNLNGLNMYQYKSAEEAITKMSIHRGMSLLAPENTLPAFRMSRKYGFTWIETDVWFSLDGTPFICHDETVDRTSNGTGNIADLTDEQLKSLDFGSWFGSEWTGTKIPTLEEALIDSRKYGYKLQIEPKEDWTVNGRAEAVIELIEKYNMAKDVIIAGFDGYTLAKVHELNEYINLGRAFTEITQVNVSAVKSLKGNYNDSFIMIYPISGITSENVSYAISEHVKIMASITNTMPDIESLINLGVNTILTDAINLNDVCNGKQIL